MEIVSYIAPLLFGILPVLLGALALYVVIRFGVKHGLRSYYLEAARPQRD